MPTKRLANQFLIQSDACHIQVMKKDGTLEVFPF